MTDAQKPTVDEVRNKVEHAKTGPLPVIKASIYIRDVTVLLDRIDELEHRLRAHHLQ